MQAAFLDDGGMRVAWPPDAATLDRASRLVLPAVPGLVVVATSVAWGASRGGFAPTRWYPGAVVALLVLGVVVAGARPRWGTLPAAVRIAIGSLAAYTAWSYLSIAWADSPGIAWEGANRTLLYLAVFGVLALSRLEASVAAGVLSAWTLGILALAIWVLLALPDPVGPGPVVLGPGVAAPTGYTNAQACLWLMAAWPALLLSSSNAVAPALRAVFAGAVVVLVDVALLSVSRGALVAAAIAAIALLAVWPRRVRVLVAVLAPAAGIAVTAPHVLDVAGELENNPSAIAELGTVAGRILLAAVVVGLVAGALATLDARRVLSLDAKARLRRAIGAGAAAVAVAGAGVALVAVGDPVDRVDREWRSFKGSATGERASPSNLGDGLTGARYDYYRVALDLFREHPLTGLGADNFAQEYLARGRALEAPAYAHSVEIRALVHTGIVGALLLALGFGSALVASSRAARGRRLGGVVAAGAAMVFVQWLVQGSADWFWEFPALGGAAFAMLGLGCSLVPRAAARTPQPTHALGARARALALAGLGVAALFSLALPWVAAIEIQRASQVWPHDTAAAYRQLDLAERLNPLSAEPALNEGTIAIRRGQNDRARRAFERALERDPNVAFAALQLGAIASARGQRSVALRHLRRAATLNPQDGVALTALANVRAGQKLSPRAFVDHYREAARLLRR
jgi:O-antigen ligase